MEWFAKVGRSLKTWARGSPPIDDTVTDAIHKEFSVLLYASCTFLDMRESKWVVSLITLMAYLCVSCSYLILFAKLAYILRDDFMEASHNLHMVALYSLTLLVLFFANYNRKSMIILLRMLSHNFYNYGDDFQITEMVEEERSSKKTRMLILVTVPTYLVIAGTVCMLGRTMDDYYGVGPKEAYNGEIYMLTPMPMWYPFKVDSTLKHIAVTISQIMGATAVAMTISGADAAMICFNLALSLQLKILIYRLQKIEECAYRLHRKNGGKKLKKPDMFKDQDFLECYNYYLGKTAQHYATLTESYQHVQQVILWPTGVAVILGSVIIAMSIFAFMLGSGRPSMLSLAGMLIIAEILNMAMLCGLSEKVAGLSESLHEEIYGLNWMDADMPAKRTMMIMIERTKRPLLYIAGLTPLNWDTFSTIMNTAYSYLNILFAAREK